jgi:hypothetical protein
VSGRETRRDPLPGRAGRHWDVLVSPDGDRLLISRNSDTYVGCADDGASWVRIPHWSRRRFDGRGRFWGWTYGRGGGGHVIATYEIEGGRTVERDRVSVVIPWQAERWLYDARDLDVMYLLDRNAIEQLSLPDGRRLGWWQFEHRDGTPFQDGVSAAAGVVAEITSDYRPELPLHYASVVRVVALAEGRQRACIERERKIARATLASDGAHIALVYADGGIEVLALA